MDRPGKISGSGTAGSARRGSKAKTSLQLPGDFIALGSKQRAVPISLSDATEPKPVLRKGVLGTKREGVPVAVMPGSSLSKRPKTAASHSFTPLAKTTESERSAYEAIAIEVDPIYLVDETLEAHDAGEEEKVEGLLCGAVKHLRANRTRPDSAIFLGLMLLVKERPSIFNADIVLEAFCSLLRRDVSYSYKSKGNVLVQTLACNILMAAFQDEDSWPETFVKVYLEDAVGDRSWVDNEDCKGFVENIKTAFNTKSLPKNLQQPSDGIKSYDTPPSGSPIPVDEDKTTDVHSFDGSSGTVPGDTHNATVLPRYNFLQDEVETTVLDVVREHLMRRQPVDAVSRNVLRLLVVTCGIGEVRLLAAQRLEMWLQNPKLMRPAQDLLMAVCVNCGQHSQQDVELISSLIKIRLKTKPLINHYMMCFRELLNQHSDNVSTILKHTIYNELSTARNPNNMGLLAVIFQHFPDSAAKLLSQVFQDLLMNKDDYLRALRALLREIVRALRHDINFPVFCQGLMVERKDSLFRDLEPVLKERFLVSVVDMVTLCVLLGVTPVVKDSAQSRGERKDMEALRNYQQQVATIQRDAIYWMYVTLPKMHKLGQPEYIHSLHKLLFMEQVDTYFNKDNWPPEAERSTILRLASDVPLLEDTLMWILLMGLSKVLPLSCLDAMELADHLVKRAAALGGENLDVLRVGRLEIIDMTFNLCAYHHPENISLPAGYTPPTLAIASMYWKAWLMLLILTAHNTERFGQTAWEDYPMLRVFMENVMTSQYSYPPPSAITDDTTIDELCSRELQIAQLEKQQVLEFESHLASASTGAAISESNSLLLSQLVTMDPTGSARKPTKEVYEQLQKLNKSLKIGQLLCRSRKPDFLLQIILKQGTSRSMPWLVELVQASESSLEVLPVQCLCEFLLHDVTEEADDVDEAKVEKAHKEKKQLKQKQLLGRLQALLRDPCGNLDTVREVLHYFLQRLSSAQAPTRCLAIKGLSMVLIPPKDTQSEGEDDESDTEVTMDTDEDEATSHKWLLVQLPTIALFEQVKQDVAEALRQACQVETDPCALSAYVQFLASHLPISDMQRMAALALDLAQLIVERPTVMNYIMPSESCQFDGASRTLAAMLEIFTAYIKQAMMPSKEEYSWSESQDQILVQWSSGEAATLHILVVQAMIISLTYGPLKSSDARHHELLDIWFTAGGDTPSAYLVDTSEEALLFPDWLKLRMIRASVERLVRAALRDLEPSQLVLFVQSFGIPVTSMDALLSALDRCARDDAAHVADAVADHAYMAQLVEVQWLRGASTGHAFHRWLQDGRAAAAETHQEAPPQTGEGAASVDESRTDAPAPPVTVEAGPLTRGALKDVIARMFASDEVEVAGLRKDATLLQRSLNKEFLETRLDFARTEEICEVMSEFLTGKMRDSFIKNLHERSSIAIPLFALLHHIQVSQEQKLGKVNPALSTLLCTVTALSEGSSSALAKVLQQAAANSRKTNPQEILSDTTDISQALTKINWVKGSAEAEMEAIMSKYIASKGDASPIPPIIEELQRSPCQPQSGLLVDWLALLDPETVSAYPELEAELLFKRQKTPPSDGSKETHAESMPHPYLLALLTHQSSWKTLHQCIALLCGEQKSTYSPEIVLDFLWACVHIPKIWQGREKKIPKRYVEEDVLALTLPQLLSMVGYILQESSSTPDSLSQRLPLLLRCCRHSRSKLQAVVKLLYSLIRAQGRSEWKCAQRLLLLIYLNIPYTSTLLDCTGPLITDASGIQTITQLDVATHRMVTALGKTDSGLEMSVANVQCRKMATAHPLLILRQLPHIAAILKGRTLLNFDEFAQKRHLALYSNMLGLLELLQPHLFVTETEPFHDVLDSYFELLQNYALDHGDRELVEVVRRVSQLLHQYMVTDPQAATKCLQKHTELLQSLASLHTELSTLRSLVARVTVSTGDTVAVSMISSRPPSPWSASQLQPLKLKLSQSDSTTEVVDVLRTLETIAGRKVDCLAHVMPELQAQLHSACAEVRSAAHDLIIKHLRHRPSSSDNYVPVYMSCLNSSNLDVIESMLKVLPEVALLCQEHSEQLIEKAFMVAMETKFDTSSYISETLKLLSGQVGS
ncbi:PREDICTED: integrator complex subunit 1-like [Priapulus caudatus]|uniref:Integrator complex subunit 1-like n=1 Tax=Priapulus caudatus TaxID=37621 RepID=A0ABM1DW04_PRICU|nr:PREDICTED: integrator complex subunit 1-like [Priapulus caudatus]